MPLDPDLREQLTSLPDTNNDYTPPQLCCGSGPGSVELSYDQFQFDKDADKLGTGGNAAVYHATVPDKDITVALKRPFPNKTVSNDTIEEILTEASRWVSVDDHPYIANVIDWGNDIVPWVAIEYLDGGTVTGAADEMSLIRQLWTAYALADAVAYANGHCGVAHHDLKPQNILLKRMPGDTWDIPKVCDWGLARELIQHDGSISQATPEYAAPEQNPALMPETDVGVHTDVYQLGVVCYELLTGEYPSHLRGEVPHPSSVNPNLPDTVDDILLRALSHNRADRHEHPILLKKALEKSVRQAASSSPADESATNSVATNRVTDAGNQTVLQCDTCGFSTNASSSSLQTGDFCPECQQDRLSSASQTDDGAPLAAETDVQHREGGDTHSSARGLVLKAPGDHAQIKTGLATDGILYLNGIETDISAGDEVELQYAGTNPTADDITAVCLVDDTQLMDDMSSQFSSEHGSVSWGRGIVLTVSSDHVQIKTALATDEIFYIDEVDKDLEPGQEVYLYCRGRDPEPRDILDIRPADMVDDPHPSAVGTVLSWERGIVLETSGDHAQIKTELATDGILYLNGIETDISAGDEVELQYVGTDPAADDITAVRPVEQTEGHAKTEWPMFQGGPARTGALPEQSLPPTDLQVQWRYQADEEVNSSPAVVDGTVYIGSSSGHVLALDATDGGEMWRFETPGGIHSTPAVMNGTVYVGGGFLSDEDSHIYAIDAHTGQERWSVETGDNVPSSPVATDDTVYVGSNDGHVYALAVADGAKRWTYEMPGKIGTVSPAITGKTVYIGSRAGSSREGYLCAIDAADGSEQWAVRPSGYDHIRTTPAVADGTVYAGDDSGIVHARDAVDGTEQWSTDIGYKIQSSPAVTNEKVFVGSSGHHQGPSQIHALDATSGDELWAFDTGDKKVSSSPAVIGETVYIGSMSGELYALDAISGEEKRRFDLPNISYIWSSPAVANGTLYVGSRGYDHEDNTRVGVFFALSP